jgi:RND family efflux transporter MFP subunit
LEKKMSSALALDYFGRSLLARLLVVILPALAAAGGALADDGPRKTRAPVVTVSEARSISFVDNLLVTGSLVAREEVLVGPEIDGLRLTELLAEEGDTVAEGQVLARLSRDIIEAQIAQNAASLAKTQAAIEQVKNQIVESEATLRQAEDSFSRVKPLRESGTVSQATFDERDAAFRTARARLAAQREGLKLADAEQLLIKAQRRELDVKLARTDIRSPAAGIVSRRTARVGAVSSATGDPLFRVIRDGEVELDAEVPEFHMAKLRAGQRARVEIEGLGAREGQLRLVSQEVNPTTRLGRVRISLGNAADLRIGTFAQALISAGKRDAVGVPATAVLYKNDSATLLVVADDKVRERAVKPGLLSGDSIEIREGLAEGEVVVMRAASLLRDGDAIAPHFVETQTAATASSPGIAK